MYSYRYVENISLTDFYCGSDKFNKNYINNIFNVKGLIKKKKCNFSLKIIIALLINNQLYFLINF